MGILTVRFESPMDISCSHCHVSIAQGTRFNAEKQKTGSYFSTPIWSFKFLCPKCKSSIEIRTDPQNACYRAVSGATERFPQSSTTTTEVAGPSSANAVRYSGLLSNNKLLSQKSSGDGFAALERNGGATNSRASQEERIRILYERNKRQWRDSYAASKRLREKFRREKHAIEKVDRENQSLKDKHSLFLTPASESLEDVRIAQLNSYGSGIDLNRKDQLMSSSLQKKSTTFKSQALQNLAIQVDMATDPFVTSFFKPRKQKLPNEIVRKKLPQKVQLVPYTSDSEWYYLLFFLLSNQKS